jgi:predicted kinase
MHDMMRVSNGGITMSEDIGLFKKCPGYKANLETLRKAFKANDIALLECTEKMTQKKVAVIVATFKDREGLINFVPLAKMFDGNPYDELIPPA